MFLEKKIKRQEETIKRLRMENAGLKEELDSVKDITEKEKLLDKLIKKNYMYIEKFDKAIKDLEEAKRNYIKQEREYKTLIAKSKKEMDTFMKGIGVRDE